MLATVSLETVRFTETYLNNNNVAFILLFSANISGSNTVMWTYATCLSFAI
jgi:hypothetical protein